VFRTRFNLDPIQESMQSLPGASQFGLKLKAKKEHAQQNIQL